MYGFNTSSDQGCRSIQARSQVKYLSVVCCMNFISYEGWEIRKLGRFQSPKFLEYYLPISIGKKFPPVSNFSYIHVDRIIITLIAM